MDSNSGKMYGVVNGVYQCQQERTTQLDERIYDRLWPSAPLQPQYSMRPVSTKYSLMPIVDQRVNLQYHWLVFQYIIQNKYLIQEQLKHLGLDSL